MQSVVLPDESDAPEEIVIEKNECDMRLGRKKCEESR